MKKLLFAAAAVWLLAACNKELGPEYETPPVFDEVTFTTATQPDKITEPVKVDEVVWVNATVSCPYKVKQVWLAYFVDGDESNVVTTTPFNYDATTVTFRERIPGQKAGAKVSFQVLPVPIMSSCGPRRIPIRSRAAKTKKSRIPTCRTKTNFYQRYRLWN